MIPTEVENLNYYAQHQAREKICVSWLKTLSTTVRKEIRYSALFGISNGLSSLVQAAIFAFLLQAIIIEQVTWQEPFKPAIFLLAIVLFRGICTYYQQVWGFEAGARIRGHVRQQVLEKISRLGLSYLKQSSSGELSRLSLEQVEALECYFSRYLPQHMMVGIVPLLTLLIVLPINWVVGVILLVTGPLVPLFMALIGMGAASAQRNQFLALSRMSGYFLDRLQGLPTLKLFGQAEQELKRIDTMAVDFRKKTMTVLQIAFLSSAVLEFFSAVSVALVAVYVGLGLLGQIHFGPANQISLREALFVLLVAPEYFMSLRQLAVFYHDKAAAVGAADAILTLLELPESEAMMPSVPKEAIAPVLTEPVIEFQSVQKSYGTRNILSAISFRIYTGEKVVLIGESGAGKTTLINLLLGFEELTGGQILLNGKSIGQDEAFHAIAWVGQSATIFYGSIAENIALANPEVSSETIRQAAEATGVMSFCTQLPHGLQTVVGERGYGLSGGQIQGIALARAFLKDSPIIVLDEPTANLDTATKQQFMDTVEQLFAHKTVLIASHDPLVAQRMSRQLKIQQGRLIS